MPRKKTTPEASESAPAAPKKAAAPRKPKAPAAPKKAPAAKKAAAPRGNKSAAADDQFKGPRPFTGRDETGRDLVIVESPAKAKTINKYLGSGYKVLASYGHVRDLPKGRKTKGEDIVGITIQGGWIPRYAVEDKVDADRKGRKTQRDIIDELKKEAGKSNLVYLASDPDREGESIAWHIKDELNLEDDRTFRIRFNEITKTAVQEALKSPAKIDMDRVKAQEARRVLDRVVGYPLSGLLGKKVTRGLSAGRVQSVAVRLLVEREREIEAFVAEEYWRVTALLSPQDSVKGYVANFAKAKTYAKKKGDKKEEAAKEVEIVDTEAGPQEAPEDEDTKLKIPEGAFTTDLSRFSGVEFGKYIREKAIEIARNEGFRPKEVPAVEGETLEDQYFRQLPEGTVEKAVDQVYDTLKSVAYTVTKVEQTDRNEKPQAPFTTSTLQQQANIRLRMSSRISMMIAQKLYEGVELGSEGSIALITYMRTDSTRVSNDALASVRSFIPTTYGDRYLPAKPNAYTSGKSAQEGHEAIRPTDLQYTPERVRPFLDQDQFRLYQLIFNRFVASQMMPAIFAITNVEVTAGEGLFKTQGKIQKFDGYRRVMAPAGKSEDALLPALAEQQRLDKLDLFSSQHFTQPPSRYNEASLVRVLEKEGIGRPSTYASIISTIQKRGYVDQKDRRFFASEIGKVVTDLLVKHFPKVMDVKFTSHMEEELDEIETGKMQYADVLDEFWGPFNGDLVKAETDMPAQSGVETGELCPKCGRPLLELFSAKSGGKFVGCSGYKDKENQCKYIKPREGEDARPEPELTDIVCPTCGKFMLKRVGKSGPFLGCSGYPDCKTTMNFAADGTAELSAKPTEHVCEKCGKPMVIRQGKRGPFLACTGYPKCKNAKDVDASGNPVQPIDTGEFCEKCNSPMTVKKGPRGPFLSCSGYPKCKNAKPLSPELKEKLKDVLPAPAPKVPTVKLEVDVACPQCGNPKMRVNNFRGRQFLGCTTYPKCKGTAKATPEILAGAVPAAG